MNITVTPQGLEAACSLEEFFNITANGGLLDETFNNAKYNGNKDVSSIENRDPTWILRMNPEGMKAYQERSTTFDSLEKEEKQILESIHSVFA